MNLELLLKNLQKTMGYKELLLDANNEITFNFEDIYISIKQLEDSLILVTRLCDIPHQHSNIYALALQENNYAAHNGYISVNNGDYSLTFTSKVPTAMLEESIFIKRLNTHFDAVKKILVKFEENSL